MSTHPLKRTGPQRPASSAPGASGGGARYDSLGSVSYGGGRDDHSADGDSYYDGDDDLSSGAREYYESGASELCTTVRVGFWAAFVIIFGLTVEHPSFFAFPPC